MGLFSSDKNFPPPPPPAGTHPAPGAAPTSADLPGYPGHNPPGYHQSTGSVSSGYGLPAASGSGWGLQPNAPASGVGYTATGYPDEKKQPYPDEKKQPAYTPQPPAGGGPLYACMVLSSSDKLRLLNFPQSVWDAVEQVLLRTWIGIQRKRLVDNGAIEFKLRGSPWYGQYSEAVPSRRMMIHLLHCMSGHGWHLSISTDLSKKSYDKDTLFFRKGPPLNRMFFSVSFNESDKVRIIDPPNDQVKNALIQALHSWPLGVQRSEYKEAGCHQVKLKGNPWYTSDGTEVNQARLLALQLMSVMDQLGYELAGSIDMSATSSENVSELDSWFFASKIQ